MICAEAADVRDAGTSAAPQKHVGWNVDVEAMDGMTIPAPWNVLDVISVSV